MSDATVFTRGTLFAHLARHPRPLPTIPGFTFIEQTEIPSRYKNDYDLHFQSPVERHPVVEKSDDICTMPTGTAKSTERKIDHHGILYVGTPTLELFQGARIVGVSWNAKYMGKWCFGWHDGVYASLPMGILRLDPPPSAAIQMDETSPVQATARWTFKSKDKDKDGADVNWLKFDRDDIITHISCKWPAGIPLDLAFIVPFFELPNRATSRVLVLVRYECPRQMGHLPSSVY